MYKRKVDILKKLFLIPLLMIPFTIFFVYITIYEKITGVIWYLLLFLLIFIPYMIVFLYYRKAITNLNKIDESTLKKYNSRNLYVCIFIIGLFVTLMLTPYIVTKLAFNSNSSEEELRNLVEDITYGLENNVSKTLSILKWFDRGVDKQENMGNIYHRWNQSDVTVLFAYGSNIIYSKHPYFCVREHRDTKDWHKWIYSVRCGMCGEYSRLFSTMCHYANLSVREVHCDGEDHDWNEVKITDEWLNGEYIEEKWIIIDSTAVNLPNSTGFNLEKDFMENKVLGNIKDRGWSLTEGNVSYVYAIYPDNLEYKEDITKNYTDVINITVFVTDENGLPMENVLVKIYSYNRPSKDEMIERYTQLKNYTNESGKYTFILGGGDYKFKAYKDSLYSEARDSFDEDILMHNKTIILGLNK